MLKTMKHDKKILKFLRKKVGNQAPTISPQEISKELGIELEELLVNLRHLRNLEYISAVNKPRFVGNLDMKDKVVSITSKGIVFLEQIIPEKLRFWGPFIISGIAVIIAVIALILNQ